MGSEDIEDRREEKKMRIRWKEGIVELDPEASRIDAFLSRFWWALQPEGASKSREGPP